MGLERLGQVQFREDRHSLLGSLCKQRPAGQCESGLSGLPGAKG